MDYRPHKKPLYKKNSRRRIEYYHNGNSHTYKNNSNTRPLSSLASRKSSKYPYSVKPHISSSIRTATHYISDGSNHHSTREEQAKSKRPATGHSFKGKERYTPYESNNETNGHNYSRSLSQSNEQNQRLRIQGISIPSKKNHRNANQNLNLSKKNSITKKNHLTHNDRVISDGVKNCSKNYQHLKTLHAIVNEISKERNIINEAERKITASNKAICILSTLLKDKARKPEGINFKNNSITEEELSLLTGRNKRKRGVNFDSTMHPIQLKILRNDIQTITIVKKPRSLLLCPQNVLVQSTLGLEISFYCQDKKKHILTEIVEDNCIEAGNTVLINSGEKSTLATAYKSKEDNEIKNRISLVHYKVNRHNDIELRKQSFFYDRKQDRNGSISIVSISDENFDSLQFVTGGFDRILKIWKFRFESSSEDYQLESNRLLHEHSSKIETIEYIPSKSHLYFGGSDCKLKIWDLEQNATIGGIKIFSHPILHINVNPTNSNCILIQLKSKRLQYHLYDPRIPLNHIEILPYKYPCFEIPNSESSFSSISSISAYVTGSWHPKGYIYACGNLDKILTWDIRYHATTRSEVMLETDPQSLDIGYKARVINTIFDQNGSNLISCSHGKMLAWTNIHMI